MKHLLGGQIGLEDFIFAHRKGKGFCDIINYTKICLELPSCDSWSINFKPFCDVILFIVFCCCYKGLRSVKYEFAKLPDEVIKYANIVFLIK